MATRAFYKGTMLWQYAKALRAAPIAGAANVKMGLSRRRARIASRSPNFSYALSVSTFQAVVGDTTNPYFPGPATLTGVGRQVTKQIYVAKTHEFLIDNTGGDKGLGYLAWVEDDSEVLAVAAPTPGGAAATVTHSGAGFAPAVGDLVLLRNATTGAGFVTTVLSTPTSSTFTCNLQRHSATRPLGSETPTPENVDITTAWTILKVAYYYDRVMFMGMNPEEITSMGEDKVAMDLSYTFQSESGILYAAAVTPTFGV